ncbi:MAG: hypothetical protein ACIAS6_01235 [Phycisphaerales bacterium JB060]
MEQPITLSPPIRMVIGSTECYRCGQPFEVAGVVGTVEEEGHEDIALLMYIEELPEEVLGLVQERVPGFKWVYSATAGHRYYGNVCPSCNGLAGDHHLRTPGAVFFPMDEQAEAELSSELLPVDHPIRVRSSYGMSGWMERLA